MFRVGDTTIVAIEEMTVTEGLALFPSADPAALSHLTGRLGPADFQQDAGLFVCAVRAWLIRLPGATILVDTGAGNGKFRPASPRFAQLDNPFLARLRDHGVEPADVDWVVNTHLHVDHIGWNTVASGDTWQPTFPNARYILPALEVERAQQAPDSPARQPFVDSVQPVLARSSTVLAAGTETLLPGLQLTPLPGHSPAMMGVMVERHGQRAMLVGDLLHSPVQVWRPDWSSRYAADPALAQAARMRVFGYAADTGLLLLAAHLCGTGGFRVTRTADGFDLLPAAPGE